jgi:hypothetical protein
MNRFNHGLFQFFYRKPVIYHLMIYTIGIIGLFRVLLIGLWVMIMYRLPSLLTFYDQWEHGMTKSRDFTMTLPNCPRKHLQTYKDRPVFRFFFKTE